jgi:hypothetical protein
MFKRRPRHGVLDLWAPSVCANYCHFGFSDPFFHGRTKTLFIRRMRGRATMWARPSSFMGQHRFRHAHPNAPQLSFDVTYHQPGGNLT